MKTGPRARKYESSFTKLLDKEEFVLLDKIYATADSVVHKARWKRSEALVAVKVRSSAELGGGDILHEARLNIEHPHIVRCHGVYFQPYMGMQQLGPSIPVPGAMHMVLEYADGGDLLAFLRSRRLRGGPIPEVLLWRWAAQLFDALQALHSRGIVHRDIKASNLLLFRRHGASSSASDPADPSGYDIKVSDLGVARMLNEGELASTMYGTPLYMSPEQLSGVRGRSSHYNTLTDMWSAGCTLYEAAALTTPFTGGSMAAVSSAIRSGVYRPLPDMYSQEYKTLIAKLLQTVPAARPAAAEALAIARAWLSEHEGDGELAARVDVAAARDQRRAAAMARRGPAPLHPLPAAASVSAAASPLASPVLRSPSRPTDAQAVAALPRAIHSKIDNRRGRADSSTDSDSEAQPANRAAAAAHVPVASAYAALRRAQYSKPVHAPVSPPIVSPVKAMPSSAASATSTADDAPALRPSTAPVRIRVKHRAAPPAVPGQHDEVEQLDNNIAAAAVERKPAIDVVTAAAAVAVPHRAQLARPATAAVPARAAHPAALPIKATGGMDLAAIEAAQQAAAMRRLQVVERNRARWAAELASVGASDR